MDSMNYNEIFDKFTTSFVGKEIRKDVILDKLSNSDDKEIIERFVTNIYIKYSVKADNINKKAEENFEEIQIIEININDDRAIYDIYGILLSIIPYPILAIFKYNNRVAYAVSNRILAEDKNNKGKIYTSYLIKEENIARYLKIDIDSCQTMIDIYNKWISNIEDVVAYYERLDRVIEIIEIGLHIKSNEVLEKLESYIARDCGTYNMKPKEGWNSKLDKYSDSLTFVKKVEIHILWEYLSENTFLKNKLEYFTNWNEFKESCLYSNSMNDLYYSQYNSRMSADNDMSNLDNYMQKQSSYKIHNIKQTKKQKIEQINSSENDTKREETISSEETSNDEINKKFDLAIRYYRGIDVEQDYKKAYELFSELAEKYDVQYAKSYIGAMYFWGEYVERDDEKAYNIFSELAEKYDNVDAKLYLADMYRLGNYVKQDYEKAFKIYEKVLENYDFDSVKFYMATMYYYGQYVEQNYEKAYNIFSELVKKSNDNVDAYYFIGKMYYYGQYVEQDENKANEIFNELAEKYDYELAKKFITEIKDGVYNNLIIEFKYIYNDELLWRRDTYIGFLEQKNIEVLEQDKYDISILAKMTNKICKELEMDENINEDDEDDVRFLNCYDSIDEIKHIFEVYDSNIDDYYFVNLRLHINNASKESLNNFDDTMRIFKQQYIIYRANKLEKDTIIEFDRKSLDKNEEGMPLSIYMNEYMEKENDDIIFRIDDLQPHIIMYISDLISLLNKNNDTINIDYIAIKPGRSSFFEIFDYLIENELEYIFKYHLEIEKIPTETLKQIENFLKGFDVRYFIERKLDNNVIINFYPRSQEVISFIIDVLVVNDIYYDVGYTDDIYKYFDGNSIWVFDASKEDKEAICELLKKPDERRYNRLKELGAPEIILKHELAPLECNYGIITSKELQEKIENILQPLKIEYKILDSDENIIKEYEPSKK